MDLLERVKELCSEKGISQRKLESELELSNGASSKWNKSSPSGEVLQKVADYFDVSTDYLLGRTDTKNPANDKYVEQTKYIESIKLDSPEEAMKFILQHPSLMAFGGYDLKEMSEEEIIDLANDLLFAMKLSLEKLNRK